MFVRKEGTKTVTVTETVHSAKVDHKFNARAKPFGASSPPSQTLQPSVPVAVHSSPAGNTSWQPPTFQAQRAPVAKTGPAGLSGPPTPPPPPNPATYARCVQRRIQTSASSLSDFLSQMLCYWSNREPFW